MTIFVKNVKMQQTRIGDFPTIQLELMIPAEQAPGFYNQITSGMVITEFSVSDQAQSSKITITRAGRKLCLD